MPSKHVTLHTDTATSYGYQPTELTRSLRSEGNVLSHLANSSGHHSTPATKSGPTESRV